MIEQTEMVVIEWHYHQPDQTLMAGKNISTSIRLDVMKKRALDKKGIACRFSSHFDMDDYTILDYVAEDSYVIDLEDKIDKQELLKMIRNSYSKYKEKFDLRRSGTILQHKSLSPLNESIIDTEVILPLLR